MAVQESKNGKFSLELEIHKLLDNIKISTSAPLDYNFDQRYNSFNFLIRKFLEERGLTKRFKDIAFENDPLSSKVYESRLAIYHGIRQELLHFCDRNDFRETTYERVIFHIIETLRL